MENSTETSVWSKKQEDLTVGEQVKVALVATVVVTAGTFAAMAAVGGAASLISDFRAKRQAKKTLKNTEAK